MISFGYQASVFRNPNLEVIKVNFPVIISIPKSTNIAPLIFWIRPICFFIFEKILKNPFMATVVNKKGIPKLKFDSCFFNIY